MGVRFHLGKPILAMLGIAAVCGAALMLRPETPARADLVLWVFADPHYRNYGGGGEGPSLLERFKIQTGISTDMQLIHDRAENVRLVSMFMADMRGEAVPDVAEIEINSIGKFFRPPVRDVGFLPLNRYLEKNGWMDKVVKSRLASYTKDGVIFGLPHDVHPVGLVCRHDLFLEAGIDLLRESADKGRPLTWERFHRLCLEFKAYWTARGKPGRHPIELRTMGTDNLVIMLLQRHLNLIDAGGRIQFTDPKFVQTVAFYAQLVAGAKQIGAQPGAGEAAIIQDLEDGAICSLMAADWKILNLKNFAYTDPATGKKRLEGKMRVIPLPVFEPGVDARTGSWGGTMIGILRNTPRPDEAWKLIEHLYLSDAGFEARIRETTILPPVISQWADPRYDRADPFFGGQKVDQVYIELARELPDRYVQPATKTALAALNAVLYKAMAHVRERGEKGLEEACGAWLGEAARDLGERISWGKFE